MIFHATPPVENVDIRKALVIFHLVMMTQSTLNMSYWKSMDDSVWTWTKFTCLGLQMVACSCGHLHLQKCQQNWLVLRLSAVLLLGDTTSCQRILSTSSISMVSTTEQFHSLLMVLETSERVQMERLCLMMDFTIIRR